MNICKKHRFVAKESVSIYMDLRAELNEIKVSSVNDIKNTDLDVLENKKNGLARMYGIYDYPWNAAEEAVRKSLIKMNNFLVKSKMVSISKDYADFNVFSPSGSDVCPEADIYVTETFVNAFLDKNKSKYEIMVNIGVGRGWMQDEMESDAFKHMRAFRKRCLREKLVEKTIDGFEQLFLRECNKMKKGILLDYNTYNSRYSDSITQLKIQASNLNMDSISYLEFFPYYPSAYKLVLTEFGDFGNIIEEFVKSQYNLKTYNIDIARIKRDVINDEISGLQNVGKYDSKDKKIIDKLISLYRETEKSNGCLKSKQQAEKLNQILNDAKFTGKLSQKAPLFYQTLKNLCQAFEIQLRTVKDVSAIIEVNGKKVVERKEDIVLSSAQQAEKVNKEISELCSMFDKMNFSKDNLDILYKISSDNLSSLDNIDLSKINLDIYPSVKKFNETAKDCKYAKKLILYVKEIENKYKAIEKKYGFDRIKTIATETREMKIIKNIDDNTYGYIDKLRKYRTYEFASSKAREHILKIERYAIEDMKESKRNLIIAVISAIVCIPVGIALVVGVVLLYVFFLDNKAWLIIGTIIGLCTATVCFILPIVTIGEKKYECSHYNDVTIENGHIHFS